jgi:hypothetical protein
VPKEASHATVKRSSKHNRSSRRYTSSTVQYRKTVARPPAAADTQDSSLDASSRVQFQIPTNPRHVATRDHRADSPDRFGVVGLGRFIRYRRPVLAYAQLDGGCSVSPASYSYSAVE